MQCDWSVSWCLSVQSQRSCRECLPPPGTVSPCVGLVLGPAGSGVSAGWGLFVCYFLGDFLSRWVYGLMPAAVMRLRRTTGQATLWSIWLSR